MKRRKGASGVGSSAATAQSAKQGHSNGAGVKHVASSPGRSDGIAVSTTPNNAFDVWLERGLHTLFDEVANEPIPPELLQLIEDDRRKGEDEKLK